MPSDLTVNKLKDTTTPAASTREQRIAASHRKAGDYQYGSLREFMGFEPQGDRDLASIVGALAQNEFVQNPTETVHKELMTTAGNALSLFAGAPADIVDFAYSIMQHAPKGVSDKPLPDISQQVRPFGSENIASYIGDPEHWSWLPLSFTTPGLNEVGAVKSMWAGARAARNLGGTTYKRYADFTRSGAMNRPPLDPKAWKETGWYKGQDGEPRFFISDANAKFKMQEALDNLPEIKRARARSERLGVKATFRLDQLMDHPELFKAYPELQDLPVRIHAKFDEDTGNWKVFNPDRPPGEFASTAGFQNSTVDGLAGIELNHEDGRNFAFSNLLHEVQHAVQMYEGFARGGTASLNQEVMETLSDATSRLAVLRIIDEGTTNPIEVAGKLIEQYPDMPVLRAEELVTSSEAQQYMRAKIDDDWDVTDDIFAEVQALTHNSARDIAWLLEHVAPGDVPEAQWEALWRAVDDAPDGIRTIGQQAYMNILGEAEARWTQRYMFKTKEQIEALASPPDLRSAPGVEPGPTGEITLTEDLRRATRGVARGDPFNEVGTVGDVEVNVLSEPQTRRLLDVLDERIAAQRNRQSSTISDRPVFDRKGEAQSNRGRGGMDGGSLDSGTHPDDAWKTNPEGTQQQGTLEELFPELGDE